MPVHHSRKISVAAKTLAKNSSSKSAKSKAATILVNHKAKSHRKWTENLNKNEFIIFNTIIYLCWY